ncbi:hypothetical protein BC834DRAFT_922368 [Gloeopeniophorella convolvens]|nr:hypothetical protein BC834DRAFT_922368 [Gloeopeniophorella convolvens]
MPLFKVPILIASAIGLQIAFTSPTPPSKKDEKEKIAEDRPCICSAQNASNIVSLALLAEAAANFALAMPDSRVSKLILHLCGLQCATRMPHLWTSPQFIIGMLSCAVGGRIRTVCYRELGRHFTFELAILEKHKLITTGPYSIVRHPAYAGGVMNVLGLITACWSPGAWWREAGMINTIPGKVLAVVWAVAVVHSMLIFARAPTEDAVLHKEFGEEWESYAARVPYRYIPGVL